MSTSLVDYVGPFTIRTGRSQVQFTRAASHWECQAVIETDEEPQDQFGCCVDTDIHCYVDQCNGSFEQAEAMHAQMLQLCKTAP